jgi:hypothetical protein
MSQLYTIEEGLAFINGYELAISQLNGAKKARVLNILKDQQHVHAYVLGRFLDGDTF